jgi:hypothetical protein
VWSGDAAPLVCCPAAGAGLERLPAVSPLGLLLAGEAGVIGGIDAGGDGGGTPSVMNRLHFITKKRGWAEWLVISSECKKHMLVWMRTSSLSRMWAVLEAHQVRRVDRYRGRSKKGGSRADPCDTRGKEDREREERAEHSMGVGE